MLTAVHPKLPMRDKAITRNFYLNQLGFRDSGSVDYPDYLMVEKDQVQLHFFLFKELEPAENYGQVYLRTDNIEVWYETANSKNLNCYQLALKTWGQREFSILDPDNNLLTFGQQVDLL